MPWAVLLCPFRARTEMVSERFGERWPANRDQPVRGFLGNWGNNEMLGCICDGCM